MKILLLDSYFGGSHKYWANQLKKYSQHEIDILSLEARHWKWRMRGGAISLFNNINFSNDYDLYLLTDMVDLALFRALNKDHAHLPHLLFLHENQFAYPPAMKGNKHLDLSYQFTNYTSALAADAVLFNSKFNQDSFLEGAEHLLEILPDHQNMATVEKIRQKSSTLPIGIDIDLLYEYKTIRNNNVPCFLWNHRWDYDKNIHEFLEIMLTLKQQGYPFHIKLLGKRHPRNISPLNHLLKELQDNIIINENIESYKEYIKHLWNSDILLVTSHHDFFGISIIEAILCDTHPLLPSRQVYPEQIPLHLHGDYLYNEKNLKSQLEKVLKKWKGPVDSTLANHFKRINWKNLIKQYDSFFSSFQDIPNKTHKK